MSIRPQVGEESSVYVNGSRAKIEEVVEWDDGILRVKLEGLGGLYRWPIIDRP